MDYLLLGCKVIIRGAINLTRSLTLVVNGFKTVIIDEAAQANTANSLIMNKGEHTYHLYVYDEFGLIRARFILRLGLGQASTWGQRWLYMLG